MPAIVLIKVAMTQPPDVSIRNWRRIVKSAHLVQGQHWHKYFLQRHFRPGARGKYSYQPRTQKYLQRKARERASIRGTPQTDLVYTGRTELMTQVASFKAFPTRCRVDLRVPDYVSIHYQSGRPQLGAELTRISDDEREILGRILNGEIKKGLAAAPRKKTDVVK